MIAALSTDHFRLAYTRNHLGPLSPTDKGKFHPTFFEIYLASRCLVKTKLIQWTQHNCLISCKSCLKKTHPKSISSQGRRGYSANVKQAEHISREGSGADTGREAFPQRTNISQPALQGGQVLSTPPCADQASYPVGRNAGRQLPT